MRGGLHLVVLIAALAAGVLAFAAPRSAAVYPSSLSAGGGLETDQRQSGALSATPRSSLRHDPTDIPVSVPSAIPGNLLAPQGVLRRDRVDRDHVEATSAAPRAHTHTARAMSPPSPGASRPTAAHRVTADKAVGHLSGTASWYCLPGRSACTVGYPASGPYAAAGPTIRAALGPDWRGRTVVVATGHADVVVTLVDWCSCPNGRLLDLYASVYGQLDSLSSGLLDVTVETR